MKPIRAPIHAEKTVARMMCAAYHRGSLTARGWGDSPKLEEHLRAAADREWKEWVASAKCALSMAGVHPLMQPAGAK